MVYGKAFLCRPCGIFMSSDEADSHVCAAGAFKDRVSCPVCYQPAIPEVQAGGETQYRHVGF